MFDLERFLADLRTLPHRPPAWTDLRTDAPIITLTDRAQQLRQRIAPIDAQIARQQRGAAADGAPAVGHSAIETLDRQREALLDEALAMEHPDHIHLATGQTILYDGPTTRLVDSWVGQEARAVRFGNYERFQHNGVHPAAQVHPTAAVHPSARVDRDAVIGPYAAVGAHAYIAAAAMLARGTRVEPGAWIGARVTLAEGVRIGPGACVRSDVVLGQHTQIGAAAEIPDGVQLARHSRVATAQHPSARRPYGATQVAAAIDRLLTLDRG